MGSRGDVGADKGYIHNPNWAMTRRIGEPAFWNSDG